jgi:hypothetical protein
MNASHGGAVMKYQLLKVVDRCEAISRRTADLTTARELRELAGEIRQMSHEAGGGPADSSRIAETRKRDLT